MDSEFFLSHLTIPLYGHLSFDGTASLSPGLNLLIGKNGSGKTTILQMIRDAANGASSLTTDSTISTDDDVLVSLRVRHGDISTSVDFRRTTGKWSSWEYLQGKVWYAKSDRRLISQAKITAPFQVDAFFIPEPKEELNVTDEFHKALNIEFIRRVEDAYGSLDKITSELEEEYRNGLVDLEKTIHFDHKRDKSPVYFTDHRDRIVETEQLSSGEKEFVYFFSVLRRIQMDIGKIVLIDEPELHLHSSQVKKLCEMLSEIAKKNQVIVATHSSDVLQFFLNSGEVVLLERGRITNVVFPEDMRALVDRLGMPIDPSVFTAHWIVAENRSTVRLPGAEAPLTDEVLPWIFGRSIGRRYWSFGSSLEAAELGVELLQRATSDTGDIKLSIVLDGDRSIEDVSSWGESGPPNPGEGRVYRLPCWELENAFLNPGLIAEISRDDEDLEKDFWTAIKENREILINSVGKTILKHRVTRAQRRSSFGGHPWDSLPKLREGMQSVDLDRDEVAARLDEMIEDKNWKWLPGKEALGILVTVVPDFWSRVRALDDLPEILHSDPEIAELIESVLQ